MDIKYSILDPVVGILPKREQVHKLGLLQAPSKTSIHTGATVGLKKTSNSSVTTPQQKRHLKLFNQRSRLMTTSA